MHEECDAALLSWNSIEIDGGLLSLSLVLSVSFQGVKRIGVS